MCCGRKSSGARRGFSGRIKKTRFKNQHVQQNDSNSTNSERLQPTDNKQRQDQTRTLDSPEIQGS